MDLFTDGLDLGSAHVYWGPHPFMHTARKTMRAKFLMIGLVAALAATAFIPSFEDIQASPSFVVSNSMNDYRIEVRLDHVRGNLILEMKNAPFLSRNVIEVETQHLPSQTITVSYIPVMPDADGYLRAELPLKSSSNDANIRLTAFALDMQGLIHQSHFWTLERRHLNKLSDGVALHSYVEKDIIEESFASVESLHPGSAMSLRYYFTGESHLYVSDTGLGTGAASFASSGTLFSAAPSLGMRLSAGPAGVFTAN